MIKKEEAEIVAEQELITGPLPLKRSWFIEDWDPQHPRYHHIVSLFDVMDVTTPGLLATMLELLLKEHDMLRCQR